MDLSPDLAVLSCDAAGAGAGECEEDTRLSESSEPIPRGGCASCGNPGGRALGWPHPLP